jgi:hypothetical protein
MKSINLLSLTQAHDSLAPDEYDSFSNYYDIDISNNELADLKILTSELTPLSAFINIFNDFFVGYKIQHISKEFDLLRFGENYVVNIEIKNNSTGSNIQKQLSRNRYYLNHINKVIYNFCFVASTKTLYKLEPNGNIITFPLSFLAHILSTQNVVKLENPDILFNPSDYLVSPFNSTEKFINDEYFLTGQQESIKANIFKCLSNSSTTFISLTGSAGTGKTLLTYDIVKALRANMQVTIVHCGNLNDGHVKLINLGWKIIPIKALKYHDLTNIDLIVADETQRIRSFQLDNLISNAKTKHTHCILSYDKQQTLSFSETHMNIEERINSIGNFNQYKLSDKIRTNKEIANFIKALFNEKRNNITISDCGNIDFDYFTDSSDIKKYISLVTSEGWEVLRLTPSRFQTEYHETYSEPSNQNSHKVIGQEFDNVAVIIDEYFSYNIHGDLIYTAPTYYDSPKMLFQNITRTRKKLKLIIIGNSKILKRCLSVIKKT